MEVWEIIQNCEVAPGIYDKEKLLNQLSELPASEVSKFCREHLHIMEFYSRHQGLYVTDHIPHARKYQDLFWQIRPVDFDAPVGFRRIK